MPQANILSLGINLKEAVKRGQLVSMTGELATTGSKEPIGVAQYDGKAGERIPAIALGLADITAGGGKTVNLITGEVSWRQRPPSIAVRGAEAVLESLRTLGLHRFIRTKDEVNKEAMLNEPELAATVAGVSVIKGKEDFAITPFEVETQQ